MVSEKALTWLMRFYPPLFFQRIWVINFAPAFKSVSVKISKSIFNKNYNKSIFGGTIFASADPFYPVLFHQIFSRKGYRIIAWVKSASIQYFIPANTNLRFTITLTDSDIAQAEQALNTGDGKFIKTFTVDLYNQSDEICATVCVEIYLRNLNLKQSNDNNE